MGILSACGFSKTYPALTCHSNVFNIVSDYLNLKAEMSVCCLDLAREGDSVLGIASMIK